MCLNKLVTVYVNTEATAEFRNSVSLLTTATICKENERNSRFLELAEDRSGPRDGFLCANEYPVDAVEKGDISRPWSLNGSQFK